MTEPLKVGFLGYRFMGEAHANALDRLPQFFSDVPAVEKHTLIGRDPAALAEAADRLGFSHTETDWKDALDDIDILYNLGPNHLHAEPSIAALEQDVHVLCEKPLARDASEAEDMRDAAEDSNAVAGVAFNYRYVPAIRYAKELIDDGAIGEVRQFRGHYLQDWLADPDAEWSWRNSAEKAGSGALGDLGAHTFDLARYLVGDIAEVAGDTRTFVDERPYENGAREVDVDDAYTALARFEDGAVGTLEASRVADGHKNDHTIAVHGTRGSIRFSLERLNELEVKTDGRGYETVLVTDDSDPYIDAWWPPGHVLGWEHTFVHENYEFLSAITDDEPYDPSFQDGYTVQEALDAVQESADTDSWVSL